MKISNLDSWICEIESLPELTRPSLEALQLSRLNSLLKCEHQRRGIYGSLPVSLSSLEELKLLPFTTPDMLSAQPGRFLLTSQSEVSRVISGATSGTTGPAKRIFYTARDTEHTVGFFAAGISEMIRPGDRVLIAFPFSGPFGLGDLIARAVSRLGGIPLPAPISIPWQAQCSEIQKSRPDAYIGFPIPLLSLLRCYGPDMPIQQALVSGDACPGSVLRELEYLLGHPLFPHYGSREMGLGGAITCPAHEGMHLRENHILAEIVDADGMPLPDGEWGELIITTIGLEAMPLIRYRTGDRTRFLPDPCPCGSVTRRIDRVSRMEHGPLSMEDLDDLLFPIQELIDYQASLQAGRLSVRAWTSSPETAAAAEEQIRQRLAAALPQISCRVCVDPISADTMPAYTGKRFL